MAEPGEERPAPAVRVVTDSTAGLPAAVVARHGLVVVPLRVQVAGRDGLEGVDVSGREVAAALDRREPVLTSQPSPSALEAAYEEAARDGAAVVAVHLPAALSGTLAAARRAAAAVASRTGARVEVVEAGASGMGLGYVALAAARAAEAGQAPAAVVAAAREAVQQTDVLMYVDTLEFLRRGGRIGAAAALLGTALSVKPLLHVVDGLVVPLERLRTTSRALQRLEDVVVERVGEGPAEVAVQHLAAGERAEALTARLRERLAGRVEELLVAEASAVNGAHLGPGSLAAVVHRL